MKFSYFVCFAFLALGSVHRSEAQAPEELQLHARLLGPISSHANIRGDKVTAQVLSPNPYTGGILEGQIRDAKPGGKLRGRSVLTFTFEHLHLAGQAAPVRCWVSSVTNSQGQRDVDEEGRVIRQQNDLRKTTAAASLGGLLGGMLGGAKGAAIGAGVAAAASFVLIQATTEGPTIFFDKGSEFDLVCHK